MKKEKIITKCRVCQRTFETNHAATLCCSANCRNLLRQFKAHGVTADQVHTLVNTTQGGKCADCKGALTSPTLVYGKKGELPTVLCHSCVVKERNRKKAARPARVTMLVECQTD